MYKSAAYRNIQFIKWIAGILPVLMVLISCQKNDTIGLGLNQVQYVNVMDTVTVSTSTLLMDSLPSAGKGVILVGRIEDPDLGIVRASSYFQISSPDASSLSIPTDAKFDSVRLKLNYSGYYTGDTTKIQQISVNQLAERLVLPKLSDYLSADQQNVFSTTATFYNRSSFKYNSTPLASISYKPRPSRKDSLMIRLPDELGSDFFTLLQNKSSTLSNTELFLNYFSGVVLRPGANDGNAVIGFTDTAQVKLYYSYVDGMGIKKKQEAIFSLYESSYQFNHVDVDRSSTELKNISLSKTQIASAATSGQTYVQGMAGLVTKVSIPYIRFLTGDDISINKAELIIETPGGSYKPFERPSQLVLLVADKDNRPVQLLSDSQTGLSALYLTLGDYAESKASYSFPLTDYINNYYKSYNNTSLLLSLPVADLQKTYNRLVVGSQDNAKVRIKLRVTYTKLNLTEL